MKRRLTIFLLLLSTLASAQLLPDLGGQRVGISTAQFLKIGVGARAIGMGESYIAVANDAEALYWNPAGLALSDQDAAFFSHTEWLVDVKLEYGGIVHHLDASNTLGAAVTFLHTDDMQETTELQPFGTGRSFGFSDFLIGLTYSRRMTTQFSFGLSVKWMQENLAELRMRGMLFDLGTYYNTGWKSTRFAVAVTNFGRNMAPAGSFDYQNLNSDITTVDAFQSFAPPTMFRIGVAAELIDDEVHTLTGSIQLNHPNDNAENVNLGMEYWWRGTFALRAGYVTSRPEENFSAGFGLDFPISLADFRLDYAFTNFGRLGNANRFSMQFKF